MRMKSMKTKITMLLSVVLAGESLAAPAWSDYPRVPGITYADQPVGIELSTYLATWPALDPGGSPGSP